MTPCTLADRIVLWLLAALLAMLAGLVVLGFSVASSQGAEAPPMPKAMPTPAPNYRTWFFAATATDTDGAESDWSKELAWTNAVRARATLEAW